MTARASRRKSWFLGVVLALAPIAAFGEDVDGQIGQLLEKIRQQDTTSGNLTELIKRVDEAIPLIMKAPPESLDRIRELSALIERKSALSRVGQAESAGGQAGGMAGPAEADSAVPAPPGTASSAPMPSAEPVAPPAAAPQAAAAASPPADTAAASADRRGREDAPVQAQAIAAPPSSVLPGPLPAPSDRPVLGAADPRGDTLFARGQQAERIGDVAAARRWYEAGGGVREPGRRPVAGPIYDPAALRRMQILGNTSGDPGLARHWYEQAAAHGDPRAPMLLQALTSR